METESKMKVVQLVHGVPIAVYWGAYFLDYLLGALVFGVIWTSVLALTCFHGMSLVLPSAATHVDVRNARWKAEVECGCAMM